MKLVSFSLYGTSRLYCIGAICNAELMADIYPGWQMVVYVRKDVPEWVLKELRKFGAETILMPMKGARGPIGADDGTAGMFWRFMPLADPRNERVIVRDVDSRINIREKAAVDEWLGSSYEFHIMKDHPHQIGPHQPISGGMWGGVGGVLPVGRWLSIWSPWGAREDDQLFLRKRIWPNIQDRVLWHGLGGSPWPPHEPYHSFVGAYVDECGRYSSAAPVGHEN